jgi:hypothetical protein
VESYLREYIDAAGSDPEASERHGGG